jgi:hypothetical protein
MIKRLKYMRWLLLLPLLLIWLLPIGVALAGSPTDVVTINAYGYIVASPSNLVLTKVNDHQVDVSWVKGWDATNTMVRAKYGAIPTDVGDGYQVYYGAGTTASDFSVNLDMDDTTIYYKAWSQRADLVYEGSIFGIFSSIRGIGMTLIALILLPIALLTLAYVFKRPTLTWASAICWVVLSVYSYQQATKPLWTTVDIYNILFLVSVLMTLFCVIESMLMRPRREDGEPDPLSSDEEFAKESNSIAARREHDINRRVYGSRGDRRYEDGTNKEKK